MVGLKHEFKEAVDAVMTIDFSTTKMHDTISLFETTIRYLGGLLAAYDLSGDVRLLRKATELGHTLFGAFDTPNRMPITHWDVNWASNGSITQLADFNAISADLGSLTLEFTRLSQLTGDSKWYDAAYRVMSVFEAEQNATTLPGMWPTMVSPRTQDFHKGSDYFVGALADSLYEYLPKMVLLLSGSEMYESMYRSAVEAVIEHIVYRPMVPDKADILLAGKVRAYIGAPPQLRPESEHLGCFVGGMLALGGRLLGNETHIAIGRKLTDGCIWAYDHAGPLGIMPEDFSAVACSNWTSCPWNQTAWYDAILDRESALYMERTEARAKEVVEATRLPPGFSGITNRHYILRPEAIESVFVLYRITGDPKLRDDAWRMFLNIQNATTTEIANAAVVDVTDPGAPKMDQMESFWLAETLKYFYLIFSETSLISLDEFVLNTEAHPLRRRKVHSWWWS